VATTQVVVFLSPIMTLNLWACLNLPEPVL